MTDNPAELNAAGLQALGRGDASTAVALLARAAAADPASPLLWYNLSTAHSVTGDQAAEAAALDKALEVLRQGAAHGRLRLLLFPSDGAPSGHASLPCDHGVMVWQDWQEAWGRRGRGRAPAALRRRSPARRRGRCLLVGCDLPARPDVRIRTGARLLRQ